MAFVLVSWQVYMYMYIFGGVSQQDWPVKPVLSSEWPLQKKVATPLFDTMVTIPQAAVMVCLMCQ